MVYICIHRIRSLILKINYLMHVHVASGGKESPRMHML